MLPLEHSPILSTFIKLPVGIKTQPFFGLFLSGCFTQVLMYLKYPARQGLTTDNVLRGDLHGKVHVLSFDWIIYFTEDGTNSTWLVQISYFYFIIIFLCSIYCNVRLYLWFTKLHFSCNLSVRQALAVKSLWLVQHMRIWYLSSWWAATVQISLHISAVLSESLLLAYTKYGTTERLR